MNEKDTKSQVGCLAAHLSLRHFLRATTPPLKSKGLCTASVAQNEGAQNSNGSTETAWRLSNKENQSLMQIQGVELVTLFRQVLDGSDKGRQAGRYCSTVCQCGVYQKKNLEAGCASPTLKFGWGRRRQCPGEFWFAGEATSQLIKEQWRRSGARDRLGCPSRLAGSTGQLQTGPAATTEKSLAHPTATR